LIFNDLSEATVKKQKQANDQDVGVFFLDKPPQSVTYNNAILRVDAFVSPPELAESLVLHLRALNRLRNQIEHYAIDIEKEDVMELLGKLHEPLINLFDAQLGGVRESQPAPVIKAWESITSASERVAEAENRIAKIASLFQGQTVPGKLFSVADDIRLPTVKRVVQAKRWDIGEDSTEIDAVAESDDGNWVVEVKTSQRLARDPFYKLQSVAHSLTATPWLAFTGAVSPRDIAIAQELGIFLSGEESLNALEARLKTN